MTTSSAALLGGWVVDPGDEVARAHFGDVAMEFDPDGSLRYVIRGDEKDQVMLLRYRVEGDELVTNQPSAPREERTRFCFTSDGRLVLEYKDLNAHYVRGSAVGTA
jgi:hypothetical protein